MKLPYRLRRPRKPGGFWYVRGSYGGLQIESSTKHTLEPLAWMFAAELWEMFANDPIMNAEDLGLPSVVDRTPEVMPLGPFELYLMTNFVLIGTRIVQLGKNKTMTFHINAEGYRQAEIHWEGRRRRVLEHRWKFLLHHRWLPRSVDHVNRVRHDNSLENLRPSTPYLQAQNRGIAPRLPRNDNQE